VCRSDSEPAGDVAVVALGFALAMKQFFIVPEADEAIIKTGGKEPVVSTGGGLWVIPLYNKVAKLSLQAIRVPIVREGANAVPSQDMIPAEIRGEMFVQVNPQDKKAIVLAVQSLGTCKPREMAQLVRDKIDSQVTDALRTAAFQKTFIELNSEKKEFAEAVVHLMQDDLAKLGLTLTAVSVTHVSQGPFTQDAGDVIAAAGRKNVAETVQRNRQETNLIKRNAEIAVLDQDVNAREAALTLDLRRKQKEADQARQVEEYEAEQQAETAKSVLIQQQSEETARVESLRAVAEATAKQAELTERAQIVQAELVAVRTSEANATKREAEESAAVKVAEASALRKVAEEKSERTKREAEIAKARAVEAALIEKEQAIRVADEQRHQAVEEAEVVRQEAVALRRAEEAAARATQATAEAKQKEAEESIQTVQATAAADRTRQIVKIQAEEAATRDKIQADKEAYVVNKLAEGERDSATMRAEAVVATARGEADAMQVRAEGYASEKTTRAKADFEASKNEAEARTKLADATLAEGEAIAKARQLLVEAENAVGTELLIRDVAVELIKAAPSIVHEVMAPVANVAHDVKVIQVNGLGGGGSPGGESIPGTILGTGMALSGILPIVREMAGSLLDNDDVKTVAGQLAGVVKEAVGTVRDDSKDEA
jgi:flotillin